MDAFTILLLLVVLAYAGVATVAAFAIAAWWMFLLVFALAVTMVGVIGDHVYDKKMCRNEKPYRLPWYYRWIGWHLGGSANATDYQRGMYYDHRFNRIIGMHRRLH